jgi:hypothetical protein
MAGTVGYEVVAVSRLCVKNIIPSELMVKQKMGVTITEDCVYTLTEK